MMINYFSCQRPESTHLPATARFKNTCFLATDEEKSCFALGRKKRMPQIAVCHPRSFFTLYYNYIVFSLYFSFWLNIQPKQLYRVGNVLYVTFAKKKTIMSYIVHF